MTSLPASIFDDGFAFSGAVARNPIGTGTSRRRAEVAHDLELHGRSSRHLGLALHSGGRFGIGSTNLHTGDCRRARPARYPPLLAMARPVR